MATSTRAEPGFILETKFSETSFGADAPGTRTPPINKSQFFTFESIFPGVEITVVTSSLKNDFNSSSLC